jgi:alanine racemase
MSEASYNQISIIKSALKHNYCLLKKRIGPDVRLLAMVKADAYGHGMDDAARVFYDAGCRDFGVAEINEGVRLRNSGIKGNIFIFLGFIDSDVSLFFQYDLVPVIYDIESAKALSDEATKRDARITVHLKVDCGMTRLGILPEEFDDFLAELKKLSGIVLGGVASHFPKADERGSFQTTEQFFSFENLGFSQNIEKPLIKHIANSGGILYFPESHCDMVRAGIALYGYYPDGYSGTEFECGEKLQPAMEFNTRIIQVKTVAAGVGVSYGHTYTTQNESVLAVLPVGYEDGLSRSLSNKGEVLVHGKRARIRGRVCMNLCMVDVSHIDNVRVGDQVTILGSQYNDIISGDEIAAWMGSISYEVLCLLGNNNERKCV